MKKFIGILIALLTTTTRLASQIPHKIKRQHQLKLNQLLHQTLLINKNLKQIKKQKIHK